MQEPIFVRTREIYHSYDDFFRLVQLSGFQTCYIDQMNMQDENTCYIVTYTGNEWQHIKSNARVIHWNMEFFDDTKHHAFQHGITERWTVDKAHADSTGALYVPMGSHYGLCDGSQERQAPRYDVALLACMSERRVKIYNALEAQGIRIAPNLNAYEGRHDVLMQTRLVVHIHQTEQRMVSPLRIAVAAAYGLPVLSETCEDAGVYDDIMPFADYDQLVRWIMIILRGDGAYYARRLQHRLCEEYTFRRGIETALKQKEYSI